MMTYKPGDLVFTQLQVIMLIGKADREDPDVPGQSLDVGTLWWTLNNRLELKAHSERWLDSWSHVYHCATTGHMSGWPIGK